MHLHETCILVLSQQLKTFHHPDIGPVPLDFTVANFSYQMQILHTFLTIPKMLHLALTQTQAIKLWLHFWLTNQRTALISLHYPFLGRCCLILAFTAPPFVVALAAILILSLNYSTQIHFHKLREVTTGCTAYRPHKNCPHSSPTGIKTSCYANWEKANKILNMAPLICRHRGAGQSRSDQLLIYFSELSFDPLVWSQYYKKTLDSARPATITLGWTWIWN